MCLGIPGQIVEITDAARLMAMAGAELLIYPTAIGFDPGDPRLTRKGRFVFR